MSTFAGVGSFSPVTPSGQTFSIFFSFAMLLIQSAYTANLAGAPRALGSRSRIPFRRPRSAPGASKVFLAETFFSGFFSSFLQPSSRRTCRS